MRDSAGMNRTSLSSNVPGIPRCFAPYEPCRTVSTDLPWGLEIDPEHRPARYADEATFHPTFLYEIAWNLSLAACLVWLGRRRGIRPPGLFALYVTGYSAFRTVEELLRVDPANHILGLRVNFFVACGLTLAGAAWFARTQRTNRPPQA